LQASTARSGRRLRVTCRHISSRADVVGIFPNEAAIIRLIGAVLLEQNDEWQLQPRYMQVEAMAELAAAADPRQMHDPFQAIHCGVEGMDAKRSAAVLLSSPAAAQRCAEGAGLDSGAAAAAQSAMPSIAARRRTDGKQYFHWRQRIHGASAPVPNLHQLDGRDQRGRMIIHGR
jgi:hypothetical protein